MRLLLTNQLVPFISVDMNYSMLSPDYILDEFEDEDFIAELEERDEDINHAYNNKEYEKFIYTCACKIFNDNYLPKLKTLELGIFNGKCTELYSPKSNNKGDELYFDIMLKSNLKFTWNKYKKKLESTDEIEDFNEFLASTYKSYDGFSSSMPRSINSLENIIEDDTDRAVAAILTYELSKDETDYQELLMNEIENKKYQYNFFNSYEVANESKILKFENFITKLK